MTVNDTIIVGAGYTAQAYARVGYPVISKSDFFYIGNNFHELIPLIEDKKTIVNCLAKTDTSWTELPEHQKELWYTNVMLVKELSEYCKKTQKKFVHLSTTDLYGNCHEWKSNTEDKRQLDLNTDYRLTKYASERMCNENDLILRIRLPFDDSVHPKNLLVKIQKFKRFYHLATCMTYLPDLVNVTEVLVNNQQKGIFNVESETDISIFYLAKNLLELPNAKDLNAGDLRVITDFDPITVFPISNTDKLSQFYKMSDLESTLINCYNKILTLQENNTH